MNSSKRKTYIKFTRTGFAIKGVIYVLSGTLAVLAATGPGGKTIGRMGVLRWVDQLTSTSILLILIGTGLTGYVVLRFMQAFKDTNHKGSSWKGLARRAGYFISGLVYLVFVIVCFYVVFPNSDIWKAGEGEGINYINKILHLPAGNIVVGIAGVFSLGYGIFEVVRGVKGSYKHHLSLNHIQKGHRLLWKTIGGIGYVARGIVLVLVGFFVLRTAFQAYVEKVHFTSMALEFLSSHLGSLAMGAVAAGLALYGIFMFVKARFYQITTH